MRFSLLLVFPDGQRRSVPLTVWRLSAARTAAMMYKKHYPDARVVLWERSGNGFRAVAF